MFPGMPSAPHTRFRADWRDTLRKLMTDKGFSRRSLSLAAHLNESAVSEWLRESEQKKPKQPSFEALASVADVLGVSLDTFTSPAAPASIHERTVKRAKVELAQIVGSVQAGVWQEPNMAAIDPDATIPYVPDPRYEGMRQYAWQVIGPSVNKIARHGDYVIGVSFIDLGRNPRDGEPVLVERRRDGTYEYTVKRVRYEAGDVKLVPDSDDPRFQEPVWLRSEAEAGVEVEATFLIIGVYRQL